MTPSQSNTHQKHHTSGGGILNKRTSISIGLLFMLILPLISVATFIAITREHINTMSAKISTLELKICQHEALGINGIAHPQGVNIIVEKLEKEMALKTRDRWTKADDERYMERFAYENKLILSRHERTVPPD